MIADPRGRGIQAFKLNTRGDVYQLCQRLSSHLTHQVSAMCFYRDFADAKFTSYLFIQDMHRSCGALATAANSTMQ